MAESGAKKTRDKHSTDAEPSKADLQRQMQQTRETLAATVEDIKDTVNDQYQNVKETVGGVLDFREQFSKEPLVWSLGSLSAGFALGYTLGYAHKEMKGGKRKHSEVSAFADSLVEELSTVGKSLVMPTLNVRIKELFGFDFSELLTEIGDQKRGPTKRRTKKIAAGKNTKGKARKANRSGKGN